MSKQNASDKGISGESESIADKYFVCTECLVEGNVQSFVDLFYLTHAVAAADETESETSNNIASYETLQFLKTRLTEAEVRVKTICQSQPLFKTLYPHLLPYSDNRVGYSQVSIRQSEYTKVFGAYIDVAKHFQSQNDHKTVRIQPSELTFASP
jgi:hypothetical protein